MEQNDYLEKKSYTQFLIKNESILVEETFIDDFFSELKFFIVSFFNLYFPKAQILFIFEVWAGNCD